MNGSTGCAPNGLEDQSKRRRPGIDRVIMLFEALSASRCPMSVSELSRRIGAPRSTTYEIVNRLLEAKLLEQSGGNGKFHFGIAMHLYGWAYGNHNAHYRRVSQTLDLLASETGKTVQLCGLRGNKYVVLDCRDSSGPFKISSDVGREVPIPWTASGRLLLGHMTPSQIGSFVPQEDYQLPDGRQIEPECFIAEVVSARKSMYCETSGLADDFTWCMAAPIRDIQGITTMTICFVLPIDTAPSQKFGLLSLLSEQARMVSLVK
jgi:DNA-binding IclR family transcriptional regulator